MPSSSSTKRGRTLPHALTGTCRSRRPSRGPRPGTWRPKRTAPRSGQTPPQSRCPPDRRRPGSFRCPRRPGAGRPAHAQRGCVRHGNLHCMPHRLLASCLSSPPACAACSCTRVLTVETSRFAEEKATKLDTETHQRHRGRGNEHGGHGHRRRCCTLGDIVLADDRGCGEAHSVSRPAKTPICLPRCKAVSSGAHRVPQAVLPVLEARHTPQSAPSVWMGQETQQTHRKRARTRPCHRHCLDGRAAGAHNGLHLCLPGAVPGGWDLASCTTLQSSR